MYIPTALREGDVDTLVAFMQANSFAVLVSVLEGRAIATHIPLVVSVHDKTVILYGHLARANPHWRAFGDGESLAIFSGPHAYVSPSLYEKEENVPTWNYIAVHAYGVPKMLTLDDSRADMEQMIDTMIDTYEGSYKPQWQGLSDTYRDGMMKGIVGFEMPISQLEGKAKLSQNRSLIDQHRVAEALHQSADGPARAIGEAMKRNLEGQ